MSDHPMGRHVRVPSHRRSLVLAAALLLALATPAVAQDQGQYGARPAPGGSGDRSSGTFHLSVGTGLSASDAVEILNFTDAAATFDLYAADAVATSGGGLAPAAREAKVTGPAAWVRMEQATVEIAGRSSKVVNFAVSVPSGASPGDQTAALLVERQTSTEGGTIASKTRIGLWLKVTVTQTEDAVLGGPIWGFPWIVIIPLLLAFAAWLWFSTGARRRQWVRERQEERALLRDLRERRRRESAAKQRH